jgi:hypothetical protein
MTINEDLIRFQQKTQDEQIQDIYTKLWTIHADVSALKVKAGLWGALSGFLTALGALTLFWLKGKI